MGGGGSLAKASERVLGGESLGEFFCWPANFNVFFGINGFFDGVVFVTSEALLPNSKKLHETSLHKMGFVFAGDA